MLEIGWLKKDLRLSDNAVLKKLSESSANTKVLIFCFEPSIVNSKNYSNRHWRFVLESLNELKQRLLKYNCHLHILEAEIEDVLNFLAKKYSLMRLNSHIEIGDSVTYDRDKRLKSWCKENGVVWEEFYQNGITRGLQNRDKWSENWESFMNQDIQEIPFSQLNLTEIRELEQQFPLKTNFKKEDRVEQKGGELKALEILNSFLKNNGAGYSANISKPQKSREHCSRLSPYLTWGCISIRFVVQQTAKAISISRYKRDLLNFKSRLHWHCHFIQKLESEPRIEFENQNYAYNKIRNKLNDSYLTAWKTGQTGVPLVDAAIRCVNTTGYINFRLRALLISFWTYNLFQPWQPAAKHLAQQFLDFEPGIHFPQVQMQAGTVGYHTMRVYNPTLNAKKHDTDAVFIKKWVPELDGLPVNFVICPWEMTQMEAIMYDFELGKTYPKPIVSIDESAKKARELVHQIKVSEEAKANAFKISKKHVNR